MTTVLQVLVIGTLALGVGPIGVHISPTVELVPRPQAVRQILDGASAFYLREVKLGKSEVGELRSRVNWVPEDKNVRLFIGRDADGAEVGSVLLMRSDSRHGPLRLAVGFDPNGTISRVIITHATEETVPWVRDILNAKFLAEFEGRTESSVEGAQSSLEGRVGAMPRYMGEVVTRGVYRSAALYNVISTG